MATKKHSKELVNATNKIMHKTFEEIIDNSLELEAEKILKAKFEENYVFENFFKELLQHSKNIEETKNKIMETVVDTLLYNDGDVSIEEIVIIIYSDIKEKKEKSKLPKKDFGDLPPSKSLCVQVDDSFIEINEKTTDKEREELMDNLTEKKEEQIIVKESRIDDYKSHKQKKNSFFKEFLRTVVPTVLITFLFITFVGQLAVVCGNSMNDNFNDGDIVFMEKITKMINKLDRFDVIVFDSGLQDNPEFIKRIIALPGEQIRIDENGTIYINGERLQEDYGKEIMKYAGIAESTVTLDENEYFVLGDNRNNSEDSRFSYVGVVNISKIKGRVCISLLPFYTIK